MPEKIEKQNIWRTMFELPNGTGYVIWDVRQVMGFAQPEMFGVMPTPNDGQIYVSVSHFFSLDRAVEDLFEYMPRYENLYIVHSPVNGSDWHGPVSNSVPTECDNCGLSGTLPCGCTEN